MYFRNWLLDPVGKRQPAVTSREFDVFLKMLVDIFFTLFQSASARAKIARQIWARKKRPGVGLTGWNWMCGCTVVYCLYGIISMLGHLYLFHA